MDQKEKLDFSEKLIPYGEDKIEYEYRSGSLSVAIYYNECKDVIHLRFPWCSYHYFAPVPGYFPFEKTSQQGPPKPGCVYENFESELLKKSNEVRLQASSIAIEERHFSLYLEWANISMDVVADSFEYNFARAEV